MATARDLVTASLRDLGVLDPVEEASAEDAGAALAILNQMLAGMELDAVPMGLGTVTLNTVLAVPDSHLEALRANLAARLAPVFGRQPSPLTVEMASRGYRNLQNAYRRTRLLSVDPGIQRRRRLYGWEL
jgi:hypothetical protein